MTVGNMQALIDFVETEDGSYYVIQTHTELFDFEKLESVEKFLSDNFLMPYWVGDDEAAAPKLKGHKWAHVYEDEDEVEEAIKQLVRKKKNPINNMVTTGGSWGTITLNTFNTSASTLANWIQLGI